MYSFNDANIEELVIHTVGNNEENDDSIVSQNVIKVDNSEFGYNELLTFFLSQFSGPACYKFTHEEGLNANEVYNICDLYFKGELEFYDLSVRFLEQLILNSSIPNVKAGNLFVVDFKNCNFAGENVNAIGVFKSETKETFIKIKTGLDDVLTYDLETGTSINKLDKGCLIFNTEGKDGYRVISVDNISRDNPAKYWTDKFLNIIHVGTNNFKTREYIKAIKDFAKSDIFEEDAGNKNLKKAELINKTSDYFQNKESFDIEEYVNEVIVDDVKKEEFTKKISDHFHQADIKDFEKFEIDNDVVRTMKGTLTKLIKMDTGIEIKVKSTQSIEDHYLEKGYDDKKQMHYYKVFFNNEN